MTNHLFQGKANYGMDMFAINIQRGRDNGIAPYVRWRRICNLTPVSNWTDLENIMRPTSLKVMRSIYKSVKSDNYSLAVHNPIQGSIPVVM